MLIVSLIIPYQFYLPLFTKGISPFISSFIHGLQKNNVDFYLLVFLSGKFINILMNISFFYVTIFSETQSICKG